MVGNFRDIEKHLEEKFSYITLIGVFEYAQSYMSGEDPSGDETSSRQDPYRRMLDCVCRHLAPGGKLVLAIENKLGMKYWAGCQEDHIGAYFSGLEGYPGNDSVRTFSRKELKDLLHSAGLTRTTFYYPYPDYKLPLTIYSDKFLPAEGELNDYFANFDRERLGLFSEPKVYDSVIRAGLFPEFSNSFLVIAEKEGA